MKRLFGLVLTGLASLAVAQDALEVISLRHRTAEQVIPVLRPLLAPGGALTGQYNQLIVRTTPANLAQLRSVLEAIDRPARRLEIAVRLDGADAAARGGLQGSVRVAPGNSSAGLRVEDARSTGAERVDQRLRVLEGGQAWIATGESRIYGEAATGFALQARLAGDQVMLDIGTRDEAFVRGGAIQGQRASTTVSGRLGEWIEIGAAASAAARSDRGLLSAGEGSASSARTVWVKVEEIR